MIERLKFFFGEFHQGVVNQLCHFVGFTFLGFGIGGHNWFWVFFSAVPMMAGNLFNYFQGKYRKEFFLTLPFQVIGWGLFVLGAYVVGKIL